MADSNETIAEIIAKMRSDANADEYTPDGILGQKLNYIADRLEAAYKRMEWTHKKELETRDAVIQTEVAAREAEREARKREIDEVVALATRYRTALARINALATYCCQPDTRAQIIDQCETIFAAERNGKTKETKAAVGDAAKLREALFASRDFIDRVLMFLHGMETTFPGEDEIIDKIRSALGEAPKMTTDPRSHISKI